MIPWDKSWIIRMGVLDILGGRNPRHIHWFLDQEARNLSGDLRSLATAVGSWDHSKFVCVGESATLYRFLQFASWKNKLNKKFITHGTLRTRKICQDPSIIDCSTEDLLKLDGGTSQWASAQYLYSCRGQIDNPPPKLQLTYDAYDHWKQNKLWEPRRDRTISRQLRAYLDILEFGKCDFTPEHSEDYCFARAFDLVTAEEGEKRWPSLRNHESNRIESMEEAIEASDDNRVIRCRDHRVLQAIAMRKTIRGESCDRIVYPEEVTKSWPQFWGLINGTCEMKA